MTLVHAYISRPGASGLVPAKGTHQWRPTGRRIDPPSTLVMPSSFTQRIGADFLDLDGEVVEEGVPGEYWVEVEPCPIGSDWAWKISERVDGADRARWFAVPDQATIEYSELLEDYQVDPDTLGPDVEAPAAWTVALAAHEADTTAVHGIADTSTLVRTGTGAGGVLSGSFPNPSFAVNMATQAELDSSLTLKTNRDLPSYVPSTVTGQYDQRTNGYNVKASNMRRIRAALGRAAATGPHAGLARIAVLGDSKSDQFNGSNSGNGGYDITFTKWPWRLRERLAAALDAPIGGTGFVKAYHAGVVDPRWTFTGTWTNLIAGPYMYTTTAGDVATFSTVQSGEKGTTLEIVYNDFNFAQWTVSVDGATSGTGYAAVTNTNTDVRKKLTLTGLSDTTHIVRIANGASSTLFLYGASLRSTGGVIVDQFAINGGRAVNYETGQPIGDTARFFLPDPDLIICALPGPNDLGDHAGASNLSVEAAITDAQQVLATWPNSDILLVVEDTIANLTPGGMDQAAWDAKWYDFAGQAYELADTLDVPLLDLTDRWGTFDDPIHAVHIFDGVHQDAAEDADWATAIADLLGAGGGGVTDALVAEKARAVDIPWRPSDNNLIGANFAPRHAAGATLGPAGFYYLNRVRVPAGSVITNIHMYAHTAGAGLTYAAAAIYEANGVRSGITASQTTAWQSTGHKLMPLGTPVPASGADRYVWVTYAVAGTTVPGMATASSVAAASINQSTPFEAGVITGASPLPSSLTMASMVGYLEFWMGIS